MKKELEDLYHEIKHGDAEHMQWLWDKMEEFDKRPSSFWGTKRGQIMAKGVHDTSNALSIIYTYINYIRIKKLDSNEINEYLNKIKERLDRANNAIDLMYTQIKEQEGF